MGEKIKKIVRIMVYVGVLVAGLYLVPIHIAYAAGETADPVRVKAVEYYEEQILVYNNNNSKIYYATELEASKGNWGVVDAEPGSVTLIDFSWLSSSTENILVIRGDKNDTWSRVKIGKKPSKLVVTIDYSNMELVKKLGPETSIASMVNIMSDVGTGENPIKFNDLEWRKGTSGNWKDASELTVRLLEKFLVNGTTLYFRIKAVDDVHVSGSSVYPDGTKGRRCSGEVKVKVSKQAAAASYTVDAGKFNINIKYGKEYRVAIGNGAFSNWVKVTDKSAKNVSLYEILNSVNYNPASDIGQRESHPFPKMTIEIRDYASSKAPASKISSITLEEQRILKQAADNGSGSLAIDEGIYVSYSGNKYLLLRIPNASADNPFEYSIFKKGESFNSNKAAWTAVTKGTEIKIPSSKALDGGTLYVRKKEIKQKNSTGNKAISSVVLPSTYVTHEIKYPTMPSVQKKTFTFIKDYSEDISFEINLGREPYETMVDNIKLGTRDIGFSTSARTSGEDKILDVTLKKESLSSLPNCNNKYIYIYFGNGTVDKASVRLTIQNATKAAALTVSTAKGTNPGTMSFTMVSSKGVNNNWSYIISNTDIEKVYTQHKITDLTSLAPIGFTDIKLDNISVSADKYLIIFETDKNGNIIKYKSIKITSDMINS